MTWYNLVLTLEDDLFYLIQIKSWMTLTLVELKNEEIHRNHKQLCDRS